MSATPWKSNSHAYHCSWTGAASSGSDLTNVIVLNVIACTHPSDQIRDGTGNQSIGQPAVFRVS